MPHLDRDGVKLYYEEAGSGEPPILLVHGWCCDHTYFAPQFEHFQRNHRVVAVDLRGHGQSDKPEQDYTPFGFADDLAWLCGQLNLQKPVVIGHSLGGVIAVELAARYPDLPCAVVAVDSPIVLPPELHSALTPLAEALHTPAYREATRQFVENALFLPTDDPELKTRVAEEMSSAPQHVMASAFSNLLTWDGAAAAATVRVPVLALSAENMLTDLARTRAACPQLVHGQTVGAGHFHQLLMPDQVNAMIDAFLTRSLARSVTS